ncbi:SdrD B-like domain-containing protein [Leucobacter luti]|uniref:SdrD B-like domain-containing protein n=1 Tax=Leucobacter luti TaxID=340320 RepID=UPI00140433A5|nr:SdrD B-like domain-containing protein [Leucobacter luti]MCW2289396.1 DNA-directed RNA polymerase II subunit RPB1 [Leucobacter luti]
MTALLVATGVSAAPAMAATGSVEIEIPGGSEHHNGQPVYVEGKSYTLNIKYSRDAIAAGHTAVISVPKGFSISQAPAENSAVESFELGDGTLTITFKDPIPVANGSIDLDFTVDTLTESSEQVVNWGVNGEQTAQDVIFKKQGDSFATFGDGSRKESNNPGFSGVQIVDGQVVLGADYLTRPIRYSITVDSQDARPVTIADTLATGMTLVPGSFATQTTVWDAQGMNKIVEAEQAIPGYSGTSFSHTFTAAQNSITVLSYEAKITDAAALEQLRTALQAQYDAVADEEGAPFSIELKNSATINGETKSKSIWVGATTPTDPRPDTGAAFLKSSDLSWNTPITVKDDGVTLDPALPVTYTLTADLTKFADFASTKYALNRNVVITDTLPANLQWMLNDDAFISGEYTLVSGVTPEALAGDEYIGSYTLEGQTIRINVGKDITQSHAVRVKAELVNVAGTTVTEDPSDNPYAKRSFSGIENQAQFAYAASGTQHASTWHQVVTAKDPKSGIDDQNKFSKRTDSKPIVLEPGQTVAQVPFTFTVANGIGDAAKSTIVDHVDHSVLDVSEDTLAQIAASITGNYGGNFTLDETSFDLTLNQANDLVFTPTASFPRGTAWGEASRPLTEGFTFTVQIPTRPIEGKAAISVKNSAEFLGADREIVFTSKTTARAGAGGREIDVTKTVYNPATDEFTTNLRAEVGPDGALVNDEYIYRVQFIPTLGYTNMLFDITDELVKNLEFVGFVDADQVKDGVTVGTGDYRIPGSQVTAKYSAADNRITIAKNQGLEGGTLVEMFFKVRIADFDYGVGVENVIGSDKVTITPTNDFPLDISKLNELDPTGTPITDRDARFELRDSAGQVVLSDLYVVGGKLRMAGPAGGDLVPTVKVPGTYTVHEMKAPAGYVLNRTPVALVVNGDGTSPATKFFNTPRSAVKTVSVGDYVWLDVDGDGVQGTHPDEQPIAGVKLVLTGPTGQPVLGVDGNPVEPQVTDKNGLYEFTDLPALQPGETYTVSIDRDDADTRKALAGLTPTRTGGSDDRAQDSEAWVAISRDDLVNDGDRDPTLDFGFRMKTYAIGDVVWIDANKNGLQDQTESVLPGVTVRLFDAQGALVGETTTDSHGLYVFDELRPGRYRVQFELTEAQAKVYEFTKTGGGNTALDSNAGKDGFSAWIVLNDTNSSLTLDYSYSDLVGGIRATQGIDPTWDAGVIVRELVPGTGTGTVPPTKTPPVTDPAPGESLEHPSGLVTLGGLPVTGGAVPWRYALGGAVLLLLGAAALVLRGRRTRGAGN